MRGLAAALALPALLVALGAQASPRGARAPATLPEPEEILPVPPIPPDTVPAFAPAPMPNADVYAPVLVQRQRPEMEARLYHTKSQFRGDGFAPYSTSQVEQERNFRPTPGVALRVPLP